MLDRERLQAPQLQGAGQVDLREFGFALGLRRTIEPRSGTSGTSTRPLMRFLNARSDWLYDKYLTSNTSVCAKPLWSAPAPVDVRSITAMTIAGTLWRRRWFDVQE